MSVAQAGDAYRSKLAGHQVLNEGAPQTIADGLKTNVCLLYHLY